MFTLKKAIAVLLIIGTMAITMVGCSSDTTYVTVNGTATSNTEFVFDLKNSMYEVMTSVAAFETDADFWNTEVDGMTPFDQAIDWAVETIAQGQVFAQKYAEYGLAFGEEEQAEADALYDNFLSQFADETEYHAFLTGYSLLDTDVKNILTNALLQSELSSFLTGEGGEYEITEEQMQQEYADNYSRVKHILFSTMDTTTYTSYSDEEVAQALADAEAVLLQLQNGADFHELMVEHTQDTASLYEESIDGYIQPKGSYVSEFEAALEELEVGEISGIVESMYGYHIIIKLDQYEKPEFYENAKTNIQATLANDVINGLLVQWMTEADIQVDYEAIKQLDPMELLGTV